MIVHIVLTVIAFYVGVTVGAVGACMIGGSPDE